MWDSSSWHRMSLCIRDDQNPGKDLEGYGAMGDVELAQTKHSACQASMLLLIYWGAFTHPHFAQAASGPPGLAQFSLPFGAWFGSWNLWGHLHSPGSPRGAGKAEPGSLPPCSTDTSGSRCLGVSSAPRLPPASPRHRWDVHPQLFSAGFTSGTELFGLK